MILQITVSPTPFTDRLDIEIQKENRANGDLIISLIDQQGKILKMMGMSVEEGMNKVELDRLDNFLPGTYCLDIKNTDGETFFNTSIIKQ